LHFPQNIDFNQLIYFSVVAVLSLYEEINVKTGCILLKLRRWLDLTFYGPYFFPTPGIAGVEL
jgi:hypothetical protein